METRTIWAVSSGEYSDYSVHLIFEAKEDAERYVAEMGDRYSVEEFNMVPAGMPFTTWKRLTVSWYEYPFWSGEPNPSETERSYSSLDGGKLMPKTEVRKGVFPAAGTRPKSGYLNVTGDDHERVRKVFTEQLAGFKLELPLLKAKA